MAIVVRTLESRVRDGFFDCSAAVTLDGRERPLTIPPVRQSPGPRASRGHVRSVRRRPARGGRAHAILRLLRRSLGFACNENDADLLLYLHDRRYPFPAWARPVVALALLLHGRRHSLRP